METKEKLRDAVKDLLFGRELREREGIMLAKDRHAWDGMLYRSE